MTQKARCTIHDIPLESYTVNGGIWLGEENGFDTSPKEYLICPQCENGESAQPREVLLCQFCEKLAPEDQWGPAGEVCPNCGRRYDWLLAQGDDE